MGGTMALKPELLAAAAAAVAKLIASKPTSASATKSRCTREHIPSSSRDTSRQSRGARTGT
jgi:hypothetical protein